MPRSTPPGAAPTLTPPGAALPSSRSRHVCSSSVPPPPTPAHVAARALRSTLARACCGRHSTAPAPAPEPHANATSRARHLLGATSRELPHQPSRVHAGLPCASTEAAVAAQGRPWARPAPAGLPPRRSPEPPGLRAPHRSAAYALPLAPAPKPGACACSGRWRRERGMLPPVIGGRSQIEEEQR
ncbi:basic proline-rich protein-like [Panicum hallii]|uniref:basic proline-rich protein-like n=1 Tax=Panicum hallii TaxID=206008 RepID=UPI000DF4CCFC|nr:basic proline-rich protein-like [Panicum hallii]